jgi:hypothetical protein
VICATGSWFFRSLPPAQWRPTGAIFIKNNRQDVRGNTSKKREAREKVAPVQLEIEKKLKPGDGRLGFFLHG